jgi:GNAT superfamily N-acetyltransferase
VRTGCCNGVPPTAGSEHETDEVTTVRRAEAGDRTILEQMLAVAADWRALMPRPVSEVLATADLAHYIGGWPAPGDFGFVAEDDAPIGAAWWRHFSATDPGYGFIDERTPEVSIGVLPEARGVGVGTLLLDALVAAAREQMLPALSLSVEVENEAQRLYQRLGFEEVETVAGSVTMALFL